MVRRWAAFALATAAVTSGCSSGDDATDPAQTRAAAADTGVTVLQPGKPGEPAATVGPDQVPDEDPWNHSDVAFVQMMIPHHAQALEMSRLAKTRASDPRVKALARRILAAQGPEILALSAWLQERNIDVPKAGEDPQEYDHGEHGHMSMEGMLTDQQMHQLEASRGQRFDRLFLEDMIGHHRGAVVMAHTAGRDGADVRVAEMSADVAVGQSAEIRRMRELLRDL
jgi:uncharacterized protein (DUF305 family)